MNSFSTRALRGHGTLGERLKKIREDREEGLETVAEKLQIQQKYLAALESGEYLKLPGDVYVRNFLKRYAGHLDVNPVTVVHLYEREMGVFEPQQKQFAKDALEKEKRIPRTILTPRGLRMFYVILGILAILVYLGFETQRIVRPPDLEIFSPPDNIRISERSVVIQGATEPEAVVYINNQEIVPNEMGNFEEVVELTNGLNTITIRAKKPQSNEREVIRTILVEKEQEE